MARKRRNGKAWGPLRPFFDSKQGQVFGLASPRDQVRDGLAFVRIARQFPEGEYPGVVFEPGCRNIQPAMNVMVVGNALLFAPPGTAVPPDEAVHMPVVAEELADRLCRIERESCLRFEGVKEQRCLVNSVTGERYESRIDRRKRVIEDYGVIRCVFRGAAGNTTTFEGNHRLATMGATKVATDDVLLDAVRAAIAQMHNFDPALPLEILVRAKFNDVTGEGVYTMRDVTAAPVMAVYNRTWVHDLAPQGRWRNRLPWDVVRYAAKDAPAAALADAEDVPMPRVEIEADLRQANGLREVARELLAAKPAGVNGAAPAAVTAREAELLEQMMGAIDLFRIEFVQPGPAGFGEMRTELPTAPASTIRTVRKQFFVQLALCRLLGRGFAKEETNVRAQFPLFTTGAPDAEYLKRFVGLVPGRMRDGFLPLLGAASKPRGHVHIDFDRRQQTYALRLGTGSLVWKVRL